MIDRVDVLEKAIDLLGLARIGLLVADREFVGSKWVKVLIDRQVLFLTSLAQDPSGSTQKRGVLAGRGLTGRAWATVYQQVLVDGQWVNVCLKQLDKQEILYLIGTLSPP